MCHVTRRKKLEHFMTSRMIEGKRSKGKQGEQMLDGVTKWLNVGLKSDEMEMRGKS